ncbi:hypothetical protein APHACPA_1188 [Rickettsia amblyommatis str. Ac/Pa]|uniref:Uncharacterized protein n=1 Tax=Rickettsia amblyommatis str. Ac/Pa TaxID=1359164 RepID=A0A0F3N3E4_RICAM|nr:hypothetical protein APHACPA_1188 [Rickettsia amblyommatis str. Ac/Pa]
MQATCRCCCMDCFMSFPRRRESSKTYKKQVFIGLFYHTM